MRTVPQLSPDEARAVIAHMDFARGSQSDAHWRVLAQARLKLMLLTDQS